MHTKKWVAAMAARGCTVLAYGLSAPQDDFYDDLNDVRIESANFQNQYGSGVLKKVSYLKVVTQLKKITNSFAPDLVHAHYATSYGLIGGLLNKHPFLISVSGSRCYRFRRNHS